MLGDIGEGRGIFEGWGYSDQTGSDMEELFTTLTWVGYQESDYA